MKKILRYVLRYIMIVPIVAAIDFYGEVILQEWYHQIWQWLIIWILIIIHGLTYKED